MRRSVVRPALALLGSISLVLCACSPESDAPLTLAECVGLAEVGTLLFTGEAVASLDVATSGGFTDSSGRYGFVSVRSNVSTARAVVLGDDLGMPRTGYSVATRGDASAFIESLGMVDPYAGFAVAWGILSASKEGALADAAEEAAAIDLAVNRALGVRRPDSERPVANERASALLESGREKPGEQPADVVLEGTGIATRSELRIWIRPIERFLGSLDGYSSSITVGYVGSSFDFAIGEPTCIKLPRLTVDPESTLTVVHHEVLPVGTVLVAPSSDGSGKQWGLMLVDPLRTDSKSVLSVGQEGAP